MKIKDILSKIDVNEWKDCFLNSVPNVKVWFKKWFEEAKLDYVKTHMTTWATGFAWVYCPFCCEGEECENYIAKQKKFNKELENIQKEKNVSFEEAEQIYISKLGPSFWKGVTDAMIYIKHKKKSLLQNCFDSSDSRT